jgi:predicted sulfurtransferase/predicted O-methyltransferase YrrM
MGCPFSPSSLTPTLTQTFVFALLQAACDSHWLFEENSPDSPPYPFFLNVDHNMTLEAFRSAKPFAALHIRVRKQIVADGLEDRGLTGSAALDWNKSGKEMDAISWHQALDDEPSAVVLDCRNAYESEVGRFDRAIPLNTTAFRDSWDAIDRALDGVDKDTPVMTYCTGGIRCIKTNAYIEQRLGFTNVNRLQGGIISYARELEAAKEVERNDEAAAAAAAVAVGMEGIEQLHAQLQRGDQVEQKGVPSTPSPHLTRDLSGRNFAGGSKFRGVNYVFDERMGARITADVLSACSTCGAPCDAFLNCNNVMCNLRFLQCPACRSAYSACCSKACETAARDWTTQEANNRMVPRSKRANANANATPNNPTGAGKGAGKGTGEGTGEGPVRRSLVLEPDFIDGTDVTGSSALPSSAEQHGTFEQQPQQPSALLDHAHAIDAHLNALNGYAERYSAAEPSLLTELREATEGTFGKAARMVSGPLQGRLLAMLARTTGARRILELGAFTGYATLCLAEGLVRGDSAVSAGASVEVEARAGNGEGGASITTPRVDTCEPDERAADVAESFFARSRHGDKISLHRCSADDLLTRIRTEQGTAVGGLLHIAFIDADKKAYLRYVQELVGGSMSLLPVPSEQDVRDARGTEWLSQIDKQPLLAEGALVIVDNTLWKGLVLTQEADLSAWAPPPSAFGAAKRMLTLANTMHDFNAAVKGSGPAINHREERENSTSDLAAVRPGRLEPVLLPVRDGLTLLRFSQEPIESH